MMKTKDGHEAMKWCGHRPVVPQFVFFTGCKVEAMTPGGMLTIFKPGGGAICMSVGQWLVKRGKDDFEIVDGDKIELAPAES